MEKEFLIKLKALMLEYDAYISWTCNPCSDTHGIYEDKIFISVKDEIVLYSDGGLSYSDIV